MKRASIVMAALLGLALLGGQAGMAAALEVPAPMVAPPPPLMLDPAADNAGPAADGTLTPAQRTHCQQLLDQISGLPAGTQWSTSKSTVTTPDGGTHPMLERQADRKKLNEAYRQECAQERR